jgi:hypothetical protein
MKLHFCIFSKPILSKYVTFNERDIIFKCRCGKKKIKRVYAAFSEPFPIETTNFISDKDFKKIANNNTTP